MLNCIVFRLDASTVLNCIVFRLDASTVLIYIVFGLNIFYFNENGFDIAKTCNYSHLQKTHARTDTYNT